MRSAVKEFTNHDSYRRTIIDWLIDWLLFYVHVQIIYGYAETDDDNDDEIYRNSDLHFKDKGSFTSHIYHIDVAWDGHAFDFPVRPHWMEGG